MRVRAERDTVGEILPEYPDLTSSPPDQRDAPRCPAWGSTALGELAGLSTRDDLNTPQLVLARRYGFSSWLRPRLEVEGKNLIHRGGYDARATSSRRTRRWPTSRSAPTSAMTRF